MWECPKCCWLNLEIAEFCNFCFRQKFSDKDLSLYNNYTCQLRDLIKNGNGDEFDRLLKDLNDKLPKYGLREVLNQQIAGQPILLIETIQQDELKMLESLLNQPELNVNETSLIAQEHGVTALHSACRANDEKMVELLLKHGADANLFIKHNNETTMKCAAAQGNLKMVKLLCNYGFDLKNQMDLCHGNVHWHSIFISLCDFNEKTKRKRKDKNKDKMPKREYFECLKYLVKQCKIQNATIDIFAKNHRGETSIFIAAKNDDITIFSYLLENIYDDKENAIKIFSNEYKSDHQRNILHEIFIHDSILCLQYLHKHYKYRNDNNIIDFNKWLKEKDETCNGLTPIHQTCRENSYQTLQYAIKNDLYDDSVLSTIYDGKTINNVGTLLTMAIKKVSRARAGKSKIKNAQTADMVTQNECINAILKCPLLCQRELECECKSELFQLLAKRDKIDIFETLIWKWMNADTSDQFLVKLKEMEIDTTTLQPKNKKDKKLIGSIALALAMKLKIAAQHRPNISLYNSIKNNDNNKEKDDKSLCVNDKNEGKEYKISRLHRWITLACRFKAILPNYNWGINYFENENENTNHTNDTTTTSKGSKTNDGSETEDIILYQCYKCHNKLISTAKQQMHEHATDTSLPKCQLCEISLINDHGNDNNEGTLSSKNDVHGIETIKNKQKRKNRKKHEKRIINCDNVKSFECDNTECNVGSICNVCAILNKINDDSFDSNYISDRECQLLTGDIARILKFEYNMYDKDKMEEMVNDEKILLLTIRVCGNGHRQGFLLCNILKRGLNGNANMVCSDGLTLMQYAVFHASIEAIELLKDERFTYENRRNNSALKPGIINNVENIKNGSIVNHHKFAQSFEASLSLCCKQLNIDVCKYLIENKELLFNNIEKFEKYDTSNKMIASLNEWGNPLHYLCDCHNQFRAAKLKKNGRQIVDEMFDLLYQFNYQYMNGYNASQAQQLPIHSIVHYNLTNVLSTIIDDIMTKKLNFDINKFMQTKTRNTHNDNDNDLESRSRLSAITINAHASINALMIAIKAEHGDCVKLLCKLWRYIDVSTIKNSKGIIKTKQFGEIEIEPMTPMELACHLGYTEAIIEMLSGVVFKQESIKDGKSLRQHIQDGKNGNYKIGKNGKTVVNSKWIENLMEKAQHMHAIKKRKMYENTIELLASIAQCLKEIENDENGHSWKENYNQIALLLRCDAGTIIKCDINSIIGDTLNFSDLATINGIPNKIQWIDEFKRDSNIQDYKSCEWHFIDKLGKGAFGDVWKVKNKQNGKLYAFKIIALKKYMRDKRKNNLKKEYNTIGKWITREIKVSRLLLNLNENNKTKVIQLCGYNLNSANDNTEIALIFDFVQNGNFRNFLSLQSIGNKNNGRKILFQDDLRLIKTFFKDLLFAVKSCHDAGIIHRDLKPGNILLDSNFNVKIGDFGLSKIVDNKNGKHDKNDKDDTKVELKDNNDEMVDYNYQSTTCTTDTQTGAVGTTCYRPPEVFENQIFTFGFDIFSLGVILFECLFDKKPFIKAIKKDDQYKHIIDENYDAFWKCVDSNNIKYKNNINDDICHLFESMIRYDFNKRAKMDDIIKSKWISDDNKYPIYKNKSQFRNAMYQIYNQYQCRSKPSKIKSKQVSVCNSDSTIQ